MIWKIKGVKMKTKNITKIIGRIFTLASITVLTFLLGLFAATLSKSMNFGLGVTYQPTFICEIYITLPDSEQQLLFSNTSGPYVASFVKSISGEKLVLNHNFVGLGGSFQLEIHNKTQDKAIKAYATPTATAEYSVNSNTLYYIDYNQSGTLNVVLTGGDAKANIDVEIVLEETNAIPVTASVIDSILTLSETSAMTMIDYSATITSTADLPEALEIYSGTTLFNSSQYTYNNSTGALTIFGDAITDNLTITGLYSITFSPNVANGATLTVKNSGGATIDYSTQKIKHGETLNITITPQQNADHTSGYYISDKSLIGSTVTPTWTGDINTGFTTTVVSNGSVQISTTLEQISTFTMTVTFASSYGPDLTLKYKRDIDDTYTEKTSSSSSNFPDIVCTLYNNYNYNFITQVSADFWFGSELSMMGDNFSLEYVDTDPPSMYKAYEFNYKGNLFFTTGYRGMLPNSFTVYAIGVQDNFTFTLNGCFLPGTMVTTRKGKKRIEDLDYDDEILVWDFDNGCWTYAKPIWIRKEGRGERIFKLTFEDGTVVQYVNQHYFFNVEQGEFVDGVFFEVGEHTMNEKGEKLKLVNKELILEETPFYSFVTDYYMNGYVNGILQSPGFINLYEIKDMKFVKDDVKLRPESDFDLPREFIRGFRLTENMRPASTLSKKIQKAFLDVMKPREEK